MKLTEIHLELKRDVRHEKYNVSSCTSGLKVILTADDDPIECKNKLYDDVVELLDDMIAEEKRIFQEKKNALKDKWKKLKNR